jgi:hypothetical protein
MTEKKERKDAVGAGSRERERTTMMTREAFPRGFRDIDKNPARPLNTMMLGFPDESAELHPAPVVSRSLVFTAR